MYADTEADRQDLYQEILIQVWKGYQKFRGECKFSTWLYQVAINTAIAGFRKEKKSPVIYGDSEQLPDISDANGDKAYNDQLELLHQAITQLNDIEKALVMLYLDGKNYDEMESIMGMASGTLRVRMNRIKDKLRKITKNN
jgi:RNA polymerase sigma-70 factor (ECF subfamily)